MLKLLIVDDSALMRRHLTQVFEEDGGFIIRIARNGADAVRENREFEPDVVTLDINMPEMDGLSALSLIMAERPVPVVMVSSLTTRGALSTFEALNLGAIDYVAKPDGSISLSVDTIRRDLLSKVKGAVRAKIRPGKKAAAPASLATPAASTRERPRKVTATPTAGHAVGVRDKVILIGVSTGGPRTLEDILPLLPADLPAPVLVAQHMPASFTKSLSGRLDNMCPMSVSEIDKMTPLESGNIYIGRGGADLTLAVRQHRLVGLSRPEDPEFLWHPSVELLGQSALHCCEPSNVLGIILTGMGNDGCVAFSELHSHGATTIAESEESAIVFGMPAELIARQGATHILPASAIAQEIIRWAGH